MLKRLILILTFTLLYCSIAAQRDVDTPYPTHGDRTLEPSTYPPTLNSRLATMPVQLPLSMAGGFAEIRPNHFHSGIDIRTNGEEGIKVYSPDDGYVSRINISAWGGGKVLYIDHPSGYRTVYMHLSEFSGKIGRYVRNYQYAHHTFAFDITLPKDSIRVRRGDLVALTGNTGGSYGPHLHYEIRLAENDQTFNPLHFGLPYSDPLAPTIAGIKLYPASENSTINDKKSEAKIYPLLTPAKKKGNKTITKGSNSQVINVGGRFYCGIYTHDRQDPTTHNKNSIEKIELFVDGELFFRYHVPTFLFEETRAINAIIDYQQYQRNGEYYIVTRHLRGNQNNFCTAYRDNGYLEFHDGDIHRLEYRVYDHKGNSTSKSFQVKAVQPDTSTVSHSGFLIPKGTPIAYFKRCSVVEEGFVATLEPYTVYENDELLYSKTTDAGGLSPLHRITLRNHPLPPHQAFSVGLPVPETVPAELRDKLTIVCVNGKKTSACPTKRRDNLLRTTTKSFGGFAVRLDTVPPKVTPVNFANGRRVDSEFFSVKISDNLSGVSTYSCTVNGQWELAEHDGKSSTLNVSSKVLKKGQNTVTFRLTDAVGNVREESYIINH